MADKGTVILVPGTLNSLVPGTSDGPYFSQDIVKAIQDEGYNITVVKSLDPLGRIEDNGSVVLTQMRQWYSQNQDRANQPIILLGHSAGGLFAMAAAALAPELPITKIILISTPLDGSALANHFFGSDGIPQTLNILPGYDALKDLTTAKVTVFLNQLRLPPDLDVYAVGGSQPLAPGITKAMDSEYISPILTTPANIIQVESDGIMDTESAYGVNATLIDTNENELPLHRLWNLKIPLDHHEQNLDYRFFKYSGFSNTDLVQQGQIRYYTEILQATE